MIGQRLETARDECAHVEAGAGFVRVELAMAEDGRGREAVARDQADRRRLVGAATRAEQQVAQALPLRGGVAVGADQADAETACVVALAVRADLAFRAAGFNHAGHVDDVVVADVPQRRVVVLDQRRVAAEAALAVPAVDVGGAIVAAVRAGAAVEDQAGDAGRLQGHAGGPGSGTLAGWGEIDTCMSKRLCKKNAPYRMGQCMRNRNSDFRSFEWNNIG